MLVNLRWIARPVKAKFHYAIWSQTGPRLVADLLVRAVTGQLAVSQMPPKERKLSRHSRRGIRDLPSPRIVQFAS